MCHAGAWLDDRLLQIEDEIEQFFVDLKRYREEAALRSRLRGLSGERARRAEAGRFARAPRPSPRPREAV